MRIRMAHLHRMTRILSLTSLGAALGACLVAGVFFAFSSFVMPAFARLPPAPRQPRPSEAGGWAPHLWPSGEDGRGSGSAK